MKKLPSLVLSVLFACQAHAGPRYPYSAEETRAFLAQLGDHVMVVNSDLTLARKQPANAFDLLTYYPLPKDKVKEYERNGAIVDRNNDIADFATYRIKDYELTNEKQERLRIRDDDAGAAALQDFALWTYDNVLCSQRGLYVKLDRRFERVKGHMTLVFEMPGNITRETRIPIDLSVKDKDPRPGT